MLPKDSAERKTMPLCRGLLDYFPDALAAVAQVSYYGNEKHNPGQPIHWERGLSMDQEDALMRHLAERGGLDEVMPGVFVRHSAQVAWRALAMLQLELEESAKTDLCLKLDAQQCQGMSTGMLIGQYKEYEAAEKRRHEQARELGEALKLLAQKEEDRRTGLAPWGNVQPLAKTFEGDCPACEAKPNQLHDECCTWSALPPPPPSCCYNYTPQGFCSRCGGAWNNGLRPPACDSMTAPHRAFFGPGPDGAR